MSNRKPKKRFRLLNPEQWGLDPSKTYIAVETEHGFSIRIGKDEWIGLPKRHVLRNKGIFKPANDGPHKR
jgi:hypothetical protein